MGFILVLVFAAVAGLLGGMGMGGGTVLIPAFTIFLGVEQHVAQAANLIAFLPMSLLSLKIHASNGLIKGNGSLAIIIAVSVLGALLSAFTPSDSLRRFFGAFLIALAAKQIYDMRGTIVSFFKKK